MYLQTLSEGSRICIQRQLTFGGGVSPRNTRLRGQSITEYVLIIAVIGLVIGFAGPGVAGAIRNQFNLVGNTVNSGTVGGASGGGSTGADSATVQAAIAKDAKDWTLDEQKAVAGDIAAKGEASPAYAKAKAAMDAGTEWSVKLNTELTAGRTMKYRIIGINHDDLADGGGKAGLTFLATTSINRCEFNPKSTDGGWEKSELRSRLNTGDLWSLMPSDFQSKVVSITKLTNNERHFNKDVVITATTDKLFLLSYSEIVGAPWSDEAYLSWTSSEGTQYEAFKDKVIAAHSSNNCLIAKDHLDGRGRWNGSYAMWWERSRDPESLGDYLLVTTDGNPSHGLMSHADRDVCPAWCF